MRSITESQRSCAAQSLREIISGLEAAVELAENPSRLVTASSLRNALSEAAAALDGMAHRLRAGSFCIIPREECDRMSGVVGCDPARRDGTEPLIQVRNRAR